MSNITIQAPTNSHINYCIQLVQKAVQTLDAMDLDAEPFEAIKDYFDKAAPQTVVETQIYGQLHILNRFALEFTYRAGLESQGGPQADILQTASRLMQRYADILHLLMRYQDRNDRMGSAHHRYIVSQKAS